MKISEIQKGGLEILNTVFCNVLRSPDRDVWKKAIVFIEENIKRMRIESYDENIIKIYLWDSARKQLCKRFGKKFICKNTRKT